MDQKCTYENLPKNLPPPHIWKKSKRRAVFSQETFPKIGKGNWIEANVKGWAGTPKQTNKQVQNKTRERQGIPHICHESHEYTRVNFFLAGVNFYRCNAKNWQFTV